MTTTRPPSTLETSGLVRLPARLSKRLAFVGPPPKAVLNVFSNGFERFVCGYGVLSFELDPLKSGLEFALNALFVGLRRTGSTTPLKHTLPAGTKVGPWALVQPLELGVSWGAPGAIEVAVGAVVLQRPIDLSHARKVESPQEIIVEALPEFLVKGILPEKT